MSSELLDNPISDPVKEVIKITVGTSGCFQRERATLFSAGIPTYALT